MTTTQAGADAPRRARATQGPTHVTTGWPLKFEPSKGKPSWVDTATGIRYAHYEIEEHPVTAAMAALTPARWDAICRATNNSGARTGWIFQASRTSGLEAMVAAGLAIFPDRESRLGELSQMGIAVRQAIEAYETDRPIEPVLAAYDAPHGGR